MWPFANVASKIGSGYVDRTFRCPFQRRWQQSTAAIPRSALLDITWNFHSTSSGAWIWDSRFPRRDNWTVTQNTAKESWHGAERASAGVWLWYYLLPASHLHTDFSDEIPEGALRKRREKKARKERFKSLIEDHKNQLTRPKFPLEIGLLDWNHWPKEIGLRWRFPPRASASGNDFWEMAHHKRHERFTGLLEILQMIGGSRSTSCGSESSSPESES